MNLIDKEHIIARYNNRIDQHGKNINGLASGTEERREIRFQVLTALGIGNGDRILDLGCGFGDYFDYLNKNRLAVNYTGFDINPLIIEEAKHKHPGLQFEVIDVLNDTFPEFDYIVSTSCFNLPLIAQDNYEFIEAMLKMCYQHAHKGVAVDFLSSYVDFLSRDGFHYSPEKILGIAKQITKRVCLRHDYPLYEFCIYLYRDFQGWGEQT